MFFKVIILFICTDILSAYQTNIDINRVHNLAEHNPRDNYHSRRSIIRNHPSNKYKDDHIFYDKSSKLVSQRISKNPSPNKEISVKVHPPREDPRLFYQSDSYLQEMNVNYEVASIYPGRNVVRANEHGKHHPMALRLTDGENEYSQATACVLCPHDRTLVAKPGSDRVVLLKPRLVSCSKEKSLKNMRFEHIYGPQFGSLLFEGTHVVVGRAYYDNRPLQLCKMQIHVITQTCPVPKYLTSFCDDREKSKKVCEFSCKDAKFELQGTGKLYCENNRRWSGKLPTCRVRTSCESPLPPSHGWISCKGKTMAAGTIFEEGSKCRVKCAKGWRRNGHTTICRRGAWTKNLLCL